MTRQQGARTSFAGAFEDTYGTAPGNGFLTLPYTRQGISAQADLIEDDTLGQGRDPLAPELDAEDVNGDVEIPIDAEAIGVWLKATFGDPSTSGSGTYTHVFSTGGWDLPSLSLEAGMPQAAHFAMTKGVMVNRLSIGQQRKGWAAASLGLIGQSEAKSATTQAGTPAEFGYKRFLQRRATIQRAGSDLENVVSAELVYENNLDVVETVGNSGLIAGADPTMAKLGLRIVMRFADTAMLDQAISGASSAFSLAFSNGTQNLTFAIPKLYLPKPKRVIEGPAGVQVTFECQAAQGNSGAAMMTATLVNGVSDY